MACMVKHGCGERASLADFGVVALAVGLAAQQDVAWS